jgi:hypothetical protein
MKKASIVLFISCFSLVAFAQNNDPLPQQKVFAIHNEKRELKHERNGKHHDFRKLHQGKHDGAANHRNQLTKHRVLR